MSNIPTSERIDRLLIETQAAAEVANRAHLFHLKGGRFDVFPWPPKPRAIAGGPGGFAIITDQPRRTWQPKPKPRRDYPDAMQYGPRKYSYRRGQG